MTIARMGVMRPQLYVDSDLCEFGVNQAIECMEMESSGFIQRVSLLC